MSESGAPKSPKKSGSYKKLDHFAVAYEIAASLEKSGGKIDYKTIAPIVGSASGEALQKCWQGIKKKKETEKADGSGGEKSSNTKDAVLKPKASKVEKKPRTPKKATAAKATTPKAKGTPSKAKTPSPKKKEEKGKMTQNDEPGEEDEADEAMISDSELDEIKSGVKMEE
ncbi:hypothetical protein MMC10_000003 [Thelotrema lepadinum]|nr:hypothetical protein [Thelotrema lepadinum]